MYRSIQILSLLVFSPLALLGNELIDYLKRYEGRWLGDFTIHSTASSYSETFPVEQRYWWEDGQLHGISVSDTNNGLKSAKSLTFIQEGKLQSQVITGETTERFFGFLRDGGIVWIPADMKRANDYQITERFDMKESRPLLLTEGFDTYVYQEGLAHLVYRGRLLKEDSKQAGD